MRNRRLRILPAILAAAVLLLPSCRREMFVIDDGLYIDMTLGRNIAYVDTATLKMPEVMTAAMYDPATGKSVLTDYLTPPVAPMYVPIGSYDCLLYNFSSEANIVENASSRDSIYIHTSQIRGATGNLFTTMVRYVLTYTKADFDVEELEMPLVEQPDYFWCGHNSFEVPLRYTGSPDIHYPVSCPVITCNGRLTIKQIGGAKNISTVQAFITNLAGGLYLWSGEPEGKPSAISFDASVRSESSSTAARSESASDDIVGTFTCYGKLADTPGHRNDLYLVFTDNVGKQYLYVYDVTEKVQQSVDFHIDLSFELGETEIDIPDPDPESYGGGFSPTVGEWDEETIYINL